MSAFRFSDDTIRDIRNAIEKYYRDSFNAINSVYDAAERRYGSRSSKFNTFYSQWYEIQIENAKLLKSRQLKLLQTAIDDIFNERYRGRCIIYDFADCERTSRSYKPDTYTAELYGPYMTYGYDGMYSSKVEFNDVKIRWTKIS